MFVHENVCWLAAGAVGAAVVCVIWWRRRQRPQQMPPLLGEQPQAPGRMPALGVRNGVVRNARRYHSITVVAEPPLLMETGHEFFGAPPARRPRRPRQPDAARRVFTTPMPSLMQALASSSSVASTCCEPAPADAGPAKPIL